MNDYYLEGLENAQYMSEIAECAEFWIAGRPEEWQYIKDRYNVHD